jgi:hypothetical protein
MKSIRSSFFAFATGALAVVSLSLSIERSALADETEGPLPRKEPDPNAPAYAPAPEPAPAPAAIEMQPMPGLPATAAAPAPAPAPVAAATPATATAAGDRDVADTTTTYELKPWDVDIRAGVHTTPFLQYGGIGASADAGMRKLGPGTFAVGGGLDYFFCGTTCSATPSGFTQGQISVEGRVSYHLSPPKMSRVDFYPLVTAGFMVSRASMTVGNSEYRASDVGPSVGFGAGGSYFFNDRFFIAAEAKLRYAAGSYSYELASGPSQKTFDHNGVDSWNASTLDLAFAVGTRF